MSRTDIQGASDELMFARSVIIENVRPQIDGSRFPIKRVIGERVEVAADIFTDGHDLLHAVLTHRHAAQSDWQELPMNFEVNDHWRGNFHVSHVGIHFYTLRAWIDRFGSWFFLVLSGIGIYRSNFLKLGVKIYAYNHHRSAPLSPALLVGLSTTNFTRT